MTVAAENDYEGYDAFLSQLDPEAAASEAKSHIPEDDGTPPPEEHEESTESETNAPEAPTEGETPSVPADPEDDDHEVDFRSGDTTTKVKLKELRAAFAERQAVASQASAMTQLRQEAAAGHQRADTALKEMLSRAEAQFEPYSKLNLLALAKDPNVDAGLLQQIQNDAQAAWANVQYLRTELQANLQAAQENAQAGMREAAIACAKVLQDPQTGIEGFNGQMWKEISEFAVKAGVAAEVVQGLTDPAAIKLIHKAMQFDKQKEAAASAATKVRQVKEQPKRTIKAATTTDPNAGTAKRDTMRALRTSGSIEDAADAFAASF